MSQSSWLVAGVLPGIERQPRKKLEPSPERLLSVLHRWRDETVRTGRTITRIAVAFEAGRDGFWLARWLEARGVKAVLGMIATALITDYTDLFRCARRLRKRPRFYVIILRFL
jgi:hypothetical protein